MAYDIYNIPSCFDFADTLARFFAEQYDPYSLKTDLILLPTRRAERRFIKLFTKYVCQFHNVQNVILPKVIPVGDIDEDDILSVDSDDYNLAFNSVSSDLEFDSFDVPPSVSYIDRMALLSSLIKQKSYSLNRKFENLSWDQAFKISMTLASFIDNVNNEELDFDSIKNIVPDNLEQHWKEVLDFLYIIKDYWNEILGNKIDASKRRVLLMKKFADKLHSQAILRGNDFKYRNVVVAGSTGSMPFTRYLIKNVLSIHSDYSKGMLVLPGLDFCIDDDAWNIISSVHPQYNLKMLLLYLQVNRIDVKNIIPSGLSYNNEIEKFASMISLPNDNTGKTWRTLSDVSFSDNLLSNISVFECENQFDEALSIALAIKDMKENSPDEKKQTLLISQDRSIVKKVISNLKKFNLSYDDSAGLPLNWNSLGEAFLLFLNLISSNYSSENLQMFFKNDLFRFNIEIRNNKQMLFDWIENNLLRGFRLYSDNENNLDLLKNKLYDLKSVDDKFMDLSFDTANLFDYIKSTTENFYKIKNDSLSFYDIFSAHLSAFLSFLNLDVVDDMQISAFNSFVSDLNNNNLIISSLVMNIDEYSSVIETIMSSYQVRENVISDDVDVIILGPIEARMQHADLIVIAGLNEGIFPKETASDPWMSRQMREKFGLPPLEKKIGLASHDFVQFLCSSKKLILTYSKKINGAEAKPSRLMYRFSAVKESANLKTDETYQKFISNIIKALSNVDVVLPYSRPNPTPPVYARPSHIYATRIETLLSDPYVFYAQNILKLNKLKDVDEALDARQFGNIVHQSIDNFIKYNYSSSEELFSELNREFFKCSTDDSFLYKFWEPRFKTISDAFVDEFVNDKSSAVKMFNEISGSMTFSVESSKYMLSARADRIDLLNDGCIRIIDYKTKKHLPSENDLKNGKSPQLVIEALIAMKGNFISSDNQSVNGSVNEVKFYALNGQINADSEHLRIHLSKDDLDYAYKGLLTLFVNYSKPDFGYIAKFEDETFSLSDYVYLKRMKEWQN